MMSASPVQWRRLPIVDLCEEHVDCVNRTAPVVEGPTLYKMIRTSNVRDGFINTEDVKYVSEDVFRKWTRRLVPQRNDIILTREAPLGDAGKVRTNDQIFLGQRLYHFRPDLAKLDPDFLLYALMAPDLQGQIRSFGSGATVEHMRLGDIPRLLIDVPSIDVQRRIGRALAAHDELVENNRRRIRILEETARAIYREWFVDLRAMKSGVERPLTECVEIGPAVAVPREGDKPFVPMGSLNNSSMVVDGVEQRTGNSGSKFQNGDTLFARITPCLENGKTAFVQFLPDSESVAFGSTEFIVLRSRSLTPEFVYLLARSDEVRGPAIKSMSGASGRQRVQEQCFDTMTVVQPPPDVLGRFTEVVRPMFRLVHQLHLQDRNLRRTRDLLLPRLMSGQLRLSDIEAEPLVAADHVGATG